MKIRRKLCLKISTWFFIKIQIILILFVLGGIGVIAGAGGDNPERAQKGKQTITAAAIGFVIVFAAYWIVQLIEFITGISIL